MSDENKELFIIKCNKCGANSSVKIIGSSNRTRGIEVSYFKGEIDFDFPYSNEAEAIIECSKCKNNAYLIP